MSTTTTINVQRVSIVSPKPFDEVVRRVTATLGQPDLRAFHDALVAATTVAELEQTVHGAIGASGLMEFGRFDAGDVLRKGTDGRGPKLLRLLVGNPLIMKEMARRVADAAAYAPITILVDERPDGVHLAFDSMASLLGPYGDDGAIAVARDLDAKVGALLEAAAH